MAANIIESKSLFFTFEDHRNEKGKGILIEQASKEIYNHDGPSTNNGIRKKFAYLTLTQLAAGVFFRIPFCVYDMLSGGFVIRAISEAKHEYKCRQIEKGEKISKVVLNLLIFKNVLINLITTIARIALYPIALVGLQLVAIFGLVSPLDGMVLYGRFEKLIGLNDGLNSEFPMLRFSAPCMQTQQTWKHRQWYKSLTHYRNDTRRSLHLILTNQLIQFAPYFGGRSEEFLKTMSVIERNIKQLTMQNLYGDEEVSVVSDKDEAEILTIGSIDSVIKATKDKIKTAKGMIAEKNFSEDPEATLLMLENRLKSLSEVALMRKQLQNSLGVVQEIVVQKDLWIDGDMSQPDPSLPGIEKLKQLLGKMAKGDSSKDLESELKMFGQ